MSAWTQKLKGMFMISILTRVEMLTTNLWLPPMRWVNIPLAGPVLPHSWQV